MHGKQANDDDRRGDDVTPYCDRAHIGLDPFKVRLGQPREQRREHQKHADGEKTGRRDQNENDALYPAVDDAARLGDPVGAV